MNSKLAILAAACAIFSITAANAAEPAERQPGSAAKQSTTRPSVGFGSGSGIGPGGYAGSASSLGGGLSVPSGGSGTQTFGGGFSQQQTMGSGPLSTKPAASTGGAAGASK